jgi:hypothetical protein
MPCFWVIIQKVSKCSVSEEIMYFYEAPALRYKLVGYGFDSQLFHCNFLLKEKPILKPNKMGH